MAADLEKLKRRHWHKPREKDPEKRAAAIRRAGSRTKAKAQIDFARDVRGRRQGRG